MEEDDRTVTQVLIQKLRGEIEVLGKEVAELKNRPSSKTNRNIINTLCRALGFVTNASGKGVAKLTYADGFGPTRTLLDVNFENAPGYMVWTSENIARRQTGQEPARQNGDIWINRFPSDKQVLAVPFYMLAEQVAQLMRYLKLPATHVVPLHQARPLNAQNKPSVRKGIWFFPSGKNVVIGNTERGFGQGIRRALEERATGTISMLPRHNPKDATQQGIRRYMTNVSRPNGDDEELVPRVDTGVDLPRNQQNALDVLTEEEMKHGGDAAVPNTTASVATQTPKKRKVGIPAKDKGEEVEEVYALPEEFLEDVDMFRDDIQLTMGRTNSQGYTLDPEFMAMLLDDVRSPSPNSDLFTNENDSFDSTTLTFGLDDFDWDI